MKILVAASAQHICDQIEQGLISKDVEVQCVHEGSKVREALVSYQPDVLICDMQSGNMGGVAVCIDARMEAEEDRSPDVAIILLLDREADRLLGERADADVLIVKPLDIFTLEKVVYDIVEERLAYSEAAL
jgi:DNA-binding response OmpR family regulator